MNPDDSTITRKRPLLFIGGTGRSGTHVLSALLENHSRYARVPIEARFHVNPVGFPDLLAGEATPRQFVYKLQKFWWRRIRAGEVAPVIAQRLAMGRKVRGLHKVMSREQFDRAVARFEASHGDGLEAACRELYYDLLWPIAIEAGKPELIEMSCFTIAAGPTLNRIFPDAKLIHIVRDGRDAGSSKVAKRQKRDHPKDGWEGVRWWEGRLRKIESGVRETRPESLHVVSLDELVAGRREASYQGVLRFLEIADEPAMRNYFESEMNAGAAHKERWRSGLTEGQQASLEATYVETLGRLEAEGFHCASILRGAYEHRPA